LATIAGTQTIATPRPTQAESVALRKELGFRDLILASILLVVVPDFFGTAVKAGPAHVVLWLFAIALFFIPQALVVAHLNQVMPLEGGLYEWARLAFGNGVGFVVAWNLWLYAVMYVASIGLVTTTFVAYAVGVDAEAVTANKWLVLGASLVCIGGLMLLAHFGLRVGKWFTNAGSLCTVATIALLAILPLIRFLRGTLPKYEPLHLAAPPLTLFSLSVFSKMTFGALCGFEYAAIFAGESRNPARDLKRAIFLSAPIIAFLYIFGTSAILAFVSPENIDLIGPIPQAIHIGLQGFPLARTVGAIAILFLLTNYLSAFCINFAGNARLPMVAGWDRLLPSWFASLHEKYRTPLHSILFMGGVTLAASSAVLIGVAGQESFEMLQIWGFTFYGIAYLALFAIPVLAKKSVGIEASLFLRAAAISGFLVTLLFVLFSVFPIVMVASRSAYILKTASVVIGANLLAVFFYFVNRRQSLRTDAKG
jgi:glutamate:GABA antiporter